MNKKPVFSIIIPTLNEEGFIPKLLTDLKNQTLADFEVIVIDGNSDDQTVKKAKRFHKHLTLTILSSQKRNVCVQRNLGAKMAKSDWLIFMDADNRMPDYFLQKIKFQLKKTEIDFFTTHIKPDSTNQLDLGIALIINLYAEAQKNSKMPSTLESLMGCKRTVFNDLSGFNSNIKWGEGVDLLSRAVKQNYKFSVFRDPVYTFSFRRLRAQGKIATVRNTAQLLLNQVLNMPLTDKKISQIYPMKGGKFFDINHKPKTNLENIFKEVVNLSPKQFVQKIKSKNKPSLVERIANLLRN